MVNKHYFVFCSVQVRTITYLLALDFPLYANSREKSPQSVQMNKPVNCTMNSLGFQLRSTESCENILEFEWAKDSKDKAANSSKKHKIMPVNLLRTDATVSYTQSLKLR